MSRHAYPIVVVLLAGLTACQAASTASASPTAASPSPSASESPPASVAPSREPVPSEDLGRFDCDFPIGTEAASTVTNIVDVRVGTHDGYDRVVFEFSAGTPTSFDLDRAAPPFIQDGSGLPIDVQGDTFLRLVMRGGTRQTETGASSYNGPTNFDPGFDQLVDLVEGGDFERQSTWYLGLRSQACARVITLAGPDRLVIDVEH